jgi:cell wall-associated NlpC family hydrolase
MKTLIDYIGVPYEVRGALPRGADCWSLIYDYAANVLNQQWPEYMYDVESNMRQASRHILREMQSLGERWQQVERADEGDLLIFRFAGHPVHCAIAVDKRDMLHTLEGRMSCIESIDGWRDRLVGIYRWIGK